jgi:hypothetical protein
VERTQIKRNKRRKEGRVEEGEKTRNIGQSKIVVERSTKRKDSPYGWTRGRMWRSKGG